MRLNLVLFGLLILCAAGAIEAQFKKTVLKNTLYKAQKLTAEYQQAYENATVERTKLINLASIESVAAVSLQMEHIDLQKQQAVSIAQALGTMEETP